MSGSTAQHYIDEQPLWPDGTPAPASPLTTMQKRIWLLTAAGKFFEGLVVFMTGVALPLIGKEFGLSPGDHGLVAAASLTGILIGASALGGLADRLGRRPLFIFEMALFCLFLLGLSLAPNFPLLLLCLFGLGLALGADYPTAHLMVSESVPSKSRGKLVLGAFAFQAVGALSGTALGYLILSQVQDLTAWRWMYASALVPALLVLAARFFVTESPVWLLRHKGQAAAETALLRLLHRDPPYPSQLSLAATADQEAAESSSTPNRFRPNWKLLFRKPFRRATILAAVPWFLQDLGTYGIGIFTPTILAASFGHHKLESGSVKEIIHADLLATKGTALIDLLLIVGILFAVFMTDRFGRTRLQILGFIGCAAGLFLASLGASASGNGHLPLIIAGFMLFNFMTNLGPNAQTYLIAGEVFPTSLRAQGAGFAASFAKIGAVATAFIFPLLLDSIGTAPLLYLLILCCLLGAYVTWRCRIDTTGKNLESLHQDPRST
ncbi:MFS transporter [Rhodovibrionaceae bacterium A322]